MLWSGSSPLAVVRDGMWGFLLFAGVSWLAISWSVLRLEPTDIVQVAGPVILFGALMEAVRALAGTRTWWLNTGLAVLFAATGVILLASPDSSFTTPAALVGWFLMVRGAADIAVSMMTRETDRIWGLLLVLGVAEAGLGFFAASSFARTADLMVSVVAGLALARGVADLVAALRLREAPRVSLLELPAERVAGVAGYSAGLTDYESEPVRPRHRYREARSMPSDQGPGADWAAGGDGGSPVGPGSGGGSFHDEVLRTTADLDAMLALAGVTGAAVGGSLGEQHDLPPVPDSLAGVELPGSAPADLTDRLRNPAYPRATSPDDQIDRLSSPTDLPATDPADLIDQTVQLPSVMDLPATGTTEQIGLPDQARDQANSPITGLADGADQADRAHGMASSPPTSPTDQTNPTDQTQSTTSTPPTSPADRVGWMDRVGWTEPAAEAAPGADDDVSIGANRKSTS